MFNPCAPSFTRKPSDTFAANGPCAFGPRCRCPDRQAHGPRTGATRWFPTSPLKDDDDALLLESSGLSSALSTRAAADDGHVFVSLPDLRRFGILRLKIGNVVKVGGGLEPRYYKPADNCFCGLTMHSLCCTSICGTELTDGCPFCSSCPAALKAVDEQGGWDEVAERLNAQEEAYDEWVAAEDARQRALGPVVLDDSGDEDEDKDDEEHAHPNPGPNDSLASQAATMLGADESAIAAASDDDDDNYLAGFTQQELDAVETKAVEASAFWHETALVAKHSPCNGADVVPSLPCVNPKTAAAAARMAQYSLLYTSMPTASSSGASKVAKESAQVSRFVAAPPFDCTAETAEAWKTRRSNSRAEYETSLRTGGALILGGLARYVADLAVDEARVLGAGQAPGPLDLTAQYRYGAMRAHAMLAGLSAAVEGAVWGGGAGEGATWAAALGAMQAVSNLHAKQRVARAKREEEAREASRKRAREALALEEELKEAQRRHAAAEQAMRERLRELAKSL